MVATREAILNGVEAELDRQQIGSQSHFDKEEILARMDVLQNELLKKVDLFRQSSVTALWNVWVGDGSGDEFLVNGANENSLQPLTILDNESHQTVGGFSSFTQEQVRLGASLMSLCFLT
jgi:hypothetical protein